MYCRLASGRPYRGYSAKFAAEQLLMRSWQEERDALELECPEVHVCKASLLTEKDINRIAQFVFAWIGEKEIKLHQYLQV